MAAHLASLFPAVPHFVLGHSMGSFVARCLLQSANQQNQMAYLHDPLRGIPFTNNGLFTLLSLMKQATEGPWTRGIPTALPILLVSGEDGPVGQLGLGIRRVAQQLQQAGFQ